LRIADWNYRVNPRRNQTETYRELADRDVFISTATAIEGKPDGGIADRVMFNPQSAIRNPQSRWPSAITTKSSA
jgi:hypothetical protein